MPGITQAAVGSPDPDSDVQRLYFAYLAIEQVAHGVAGYQVKLVKGQSGRGAHRVGPGYISIGTEADVGAFKGVRPQFVEYTGNNVVAGIHTKIDGPIQVGVGIQYAFAGSTQLASNGHAITAIFKGIDQVIDQRGHLALLLRVPQGHRFNRARGIGHGIPRWFRRQDKGCKVG